MIGIEKIFELADKVGAIDALKTRLLSQPDKAAEKLAESLDELYKMFQALDDEIVSYLSLSFEPEDTANKARAVLLGMEVGQSRIRMHEARGHCSKIKNIYAKHLSGWFDRVFGTPSERDDVQRLFERMGTVDDATVAAVDVVTAWLTQEAEKTLNLLDSDNRPFASQSVRQARLDVKPARVRLTEAMSQLRALQADFIAASKTV